MRVALCVVDSQYSAMSTHDSERVEPTLDRATATLKTALDQACGTNVEHANTGELIRIEHVLAIAGEAAREAISVRRRLNHEPDRRRAASEASGGMSREVTDARGTRWTIFEVHPSASGGWPSVRERYRDGWLAFDCGAETRRMAPIPGGWQDLTDADLLALCGDAEPAARRERRL